MISGKAFHSAVNRLHAELLLKNLTELELLFKPTKTERKIKNCFWNLIFCSTLERKIKLSSVYLGTCTYTNFYNHFLKYPHKVAWLLCCDPTTNKALEILRLPFINKMNEILTLSIYNKNGSLSPRNITQIIKAFEVISKLQP